MVLKKRLAMIGAILAIAPAAITIAQIPISSPVLVAGNALRYQIDGAGNGIPDFSQAGYGAPGAAIPQMPVVMRVAGGGSAEIQAAIDAVSARAPDARGLRGAVLLGPGVFALDRRIRINADGVVLRGSGPGGARGTTLVARAPMSVMVLFDGRGAAVESGPQTPLSAPVPIGATTIAIADTAGFRPGDMVIVRRPFTAGWIRSIGMDRIAPRADGKPVNPWQPSGGLAFERRVMAVRAGSLMLDAPITDRIERADGGYVQHFGFPGRVRNVGVENLALRGIPAAQLTQKNGSPVPDTGVKFQRAADGWATNLRIDEFGTFIDIGRSARDITVDGVRGGITAPRWKGIPFIYNIAGQRSLIQNCAFTGDRAHVWTTQAATAGPNVFRRCTASGNKLDAGPHQRWASGTLYEGLSITGEFGLDDRGNFGTGQGWSGSSQVLWNSTATAGTKLGQAPGSYNWAVGTRGRINGNPDAPGTVASPGRPVFPLSLFDAQVKQALDRSSAPGGVRPWEPAARGERRPAMGASPRR